MSFLMKAVLRAALRIVFSVILGTAVLSLAGVSSAEAAKKRKSSPASASAAGIQSPARYRDQNLFPKGPLYFGGVYLGDDPDPFIRSQILRDAAARFGGSD